MIRSGQISLDDDSKDVEEVAAPSIDPPSQSLANHVELNKLPVSDLSNLSGAAAYLVMLRYTVVPMELLVLLVYFSSVRPCCPGCIDRIVVDINGCELVR